MPAHASQEDCITAGHDRYDGNFWDSGGAVRIDIHHSSDPPPLVHQMLQIPARARRVDLVCRNNRQLTPALLWLLHA